MHPHTHTHTDKHTSPHTLLLIYPHTTHAHKHSCMLAPLPLTPDPAWAQRRRDSSHTQPQSQPPGEGKHRIPRGLPSLTD